jgi:hypothetical protein
MGLIGYLPIGRRTGLADPFAPSTPLPDSKIVGDPKYLLLRSVKLIDARVINPRKPQASRPIGAFEVAYAQRLIPKLGLAGMLNSRRVTEQADRIARLRAATPVALGRGAQTGWDWIKGGRTIKPTNIGGVRGAFAVMKRATERGTQAQQIMQPISTTVALAARAAVGEAAPVVIAQSPVSEDVTPRITAPVGQSEPMETRTEAGAFQWVYLAAAVGIAWLVLRGGK